MQPLVSMLVPVVSRDGRFVETLQDAVKDAAAQGDEDRKVMRAVDDYMTCCLPVIQCF